MRNWKNVRYYFTYNYRTEFNAKSRELGWVACDGSDWDLTLKYVEDDVVAAVRGLYPIIGGEVAGLDVTVADWDCDGTVHLMVENAQSDEFFTELEPRPNGSKLRFTNGFLDVLSWQGYGRGPSDSGWMTVSSFAVNDPERRLTRIGTVQQSSESRNIEKVETPDRHLRMAREWARERYHLAKFDSLETPEPFEFSCDGGRFTIDIVSKREIYRFNAASKNEWAALIVVQPAGGGDAFLVLDHEVADEQLVGQRLIEILDLLDKETGLLARRARAFIRNHQLDA